jgi:hypothetical protein
MANPLIVSDDGNLGMAHHESDQFLSSPWDDEINLIIQLEHLLDHFSLGMGNELNRLLGKTRPHDGLLKDMPDGFVGVKGL